MKYLSFLACLLGLGLFWSCAPTTSGGNSGTASSSGNQRPLPILRAQNLEYHNRIKSVQLYPDSGDPTSQLLPAVTPLVGRQQLVLHFDDLQRDSKEYSVKLLHCDYNWEISQLSPLEYLYDYNEFPITEYSFSSNTLREYVHYRFAVPQVKLSGNYLLVVYQNRNPKDLVLTRRFMVYENLAPVQTHLVAAPGGARLQMQQIDLDVLYGNLAGITDPTTQLKVVLRQNQRWDNAIFGLRPTGDRTGTQVLEFQLFDLSNAYLGGNEFRFFDLRTVRASGQNVGAIRADSTAYRLDAFLLPDKPRGQLAYGSTREDINGNFIISNLDIADDPLITSEYADVHFFLKRDEPYTSPVYVAGDFSNYLQQEPYRMVYDAELGGYRADVLLKQGWYNYQYLAPQKETALLLEGSFSETENFYEVFVYYRPYNKPADFLVGYGRLSTDR